MEAPQHEEQKEFRKQLHDFWQLECGVSWQHLRTNIEQLMQDNLDKAQQLELHSQLNESHTQLQEKNSQLQLSLAQLKTDREVLEGSLPESKAVLLHMSWQELVRQQTWCPTFTLSWPSSQMKRKSSAAFFLSFFKDQFDVKI